MKSIDTLRAHGETRYQKRVTESATRVAELLRRALEDDKLDEQEPHYANLGRLPRGTVDKYQSDVMAKVGEIAGSDVMNLVVIDQELSDQATIDLLEAGAGHARPEPVVAFLRAR